MKLFGAVFGAVIVASFAMPVLAPAETRVALVIGNSAYDAAPALPNTRNDAEAVAAALGRLGFEVTLRTDLGREAFGAELKAFGDNARGADWALVFFAGHGMQIDGETYLLPVDAKLLHASHVEDETISLASMRAKAGQARGLRIVILDACRNNPFLARLKTDGPIKRSVNRGLARVEAASGELVAYATRENDVADDGPSKLSPFTEALLAHIEEPGVEIGLLFRKVRARVLKATGNNQDPVVYAALPEGAVYFKTIQTGQAIEARADSSPVDETPIPPRPMLATRTTLWSWTFGKPDAAAVALAVLPDEGLGIAGWTDSKGAGESDVWIFRLDNSGKLLWDKTFGGIQPDTASGIAVLPDGGFVVAADTDSKGAGDTDIWILRLDRNGKLLWDKTFGGKKRDVAAGIVVLPDGGFAVAGSTESRGAGNRDAWLLRLDSTGKLLWDKTYGSEHDDSLKAVVASADGSLGLAGATMLRGTDDMDGWVLRVNSTGEILWDKTFGGEQGDSLEAIAVLSDGNFVVGGRTKEHLSHEWDGDLRENEAWVLKLSSQGALLWESTFNKQGDNSARAVVDMPHDGFMVLSRNGPNIWALIMNSEGTFIRDKNFEGGWNGSAVALSTGGFAVAATRDRKAWVFTIPPEDMLPATAARP